MACAASTSFARSDRELLEDCMCAICRSILIHPVTLPCGHELCMPCFKQTVEEASLCCPLCRTRISTWARRASKANALVNEPRWKQIQNLFPARVQRRLNGLDDETDDDDDDNEEIGARYRQMIHLSKPGEIRKEYEEELQRLTALQEEERQKEEEASAALIQHLQSVEEEEAEAIRRSQEEIAACDEELAKKLAKAVSPETPVTVLKEAASSRESSTDSTDCAPVSGLLERERKPLSNKEGSKTLETFFRRLPPGVRPASRCSPSLSRGPVSNPHLDQWLKDTLSERPVSTPGCSGASDTDGWSDDGEARKQDKPGKSLKQRGVAQQSHTPLPTCSKFAKDCFTKADPKSVQDKSKVEKGSTFLFKPIVSCPQTPPKRLPTGEETASCVVLITPRSICSATVHSVSSLSAKDSVVKRTDCVKQKTEQSDRPERCKDTHQSMGSFKSKLFDRDDGTETSGLDLEMDRVECVSTSQERQLTTMSPVRHSVSSSIHSVSDIVHKSPYSCPSVSEFRERTHLSPGKLHSPSASPVSKSLHHDAVRVNGDSELTKSKRSPDPTPSTSAASKPVGIFNPATVPQWSEGLYTEGRDSTSNSSSHSITSNGTSGHRSPSPSKKVTGKKNSGRKTRRNDDDDMAPTKPAKIRKLTALEKDHEVTTDKTDKILRTFPNKTAGEQSVKEKTSLVCSQGAPGASKSVDTISMSSPARNGLTEHESPSKTSVISISSETSVTSEVTEKVPDRCKKTAQRVKKASNSNSSNTQATTASSISAKSSMANADSDSSSTGLQKSIRDWFSPKGKKGSKTSSSKKCNLKKEQSDAKMSQNFPASSVSSSDVSASAAASWTSLSFSFSSSDEQSPAGPAVKSKALNRSRKGKGGCSCCTTETCTSGRLDKFLSLNSSSSKSNLTPTKSKGNSIKTKRVEESVENSLSESEEEMEGLTQEEKDLRLAIKLQAQFDLADKLHMNVVRFKGSDNEYSLRRGQSKSKLKQNETP